MPIIKKLIYVISTCCLLLATSVSTAKDVIHDAKYYLQQASKAYNQKNYQKAEKSFQQLLKMKVSLHEEFYYFYGKTLYHNAKYKKSVSNLRAFIKNTTKKNKYYGDAKHLLMRAEKKWDQSKPTKIKTKKQSTKLSDIPEMIKIPAGSFTMGTNHGSPDQKPPHKIKLKNSFAMGKYEVTFAQYDTFAQATKQKRPNDLGWGRGSRPVINVSLKNALDYTLWLSKKTNRTFRLPTEQEWEYVARTGIKQQLGFSDLIGLGDANCDGCRYFWESAKTVEVGAFEANKYGIHDLFGNVWEWTCSVYTKRYNGAEKSCAKKHDLDGKTIAVRGGGWNSFSATLRPYIRYNNYPSYLGNELGFRLVEELE